ncbi:MAG: hypothetical protein OCD01_10125 [Fibrobacterales bacterium]
MTHIQKLTTILILGISMLFFTGCFEDAGTNTGSEESSEESKDDSSEAEVAGDDSSAEESSQASTDEPSSEDVVESSSEETEELSSEEAAESSEVAEVESSSSVVVVEESSSEAVEESSSSESALLGGDPLRVPATSTESWDYFMMGDVKLLLNKWGSDALAKDGSCGSTYEIWAKEDKTFGWTFDRPDCGGSGAYPDYPEIEVGVAPFTDPEDADLRKSTSIILPMKIKDITSASVTLDDFRIDLTSDASWNINFELWLSQEDPTTTRTPKPEFELMTFWGWFDGRWPCDQAGGKFAGNTTLPKGEGSMDYTLCHYGPDWGGDDHSKWDYFQFRAGDGSDGNAKRDFTGKLDVKEALDWLVTHAGASPDLWVTRFEVGTEIDNNTAGTVSFKGVTFEVNGEEREALFK